MTEKATLIDPSGEGKRAGVFDNPPETVPASVISFLRLAEREGSYATLTDRTRERIELRFLEGLKEVQIAKRQNVSKQAVSQTLKMFPGMLYKKMEKDVYFRRTQISFREILLRYSDCMVYFQEQRKPKAPDSKRPFYPVV